MLSVHRCGYNWMYCDGDCLNCNYVTRTSTSNSTTGATPCTANCQYKAPSGFCSLTTCPYRFYAINPMPTVVGNDGLVYAKQEKKPIKVKVRKVRRKRNG